MGSFKQATRNLSKCIHVGAQEELMTSAWSPRSIFTATRHLQKSKTDKEVKETCEKVIEAAEAVKEGAKNVSNMSEVVSAKVSESAEAVIDKAKDTVLKETAQTIKDKILGK
ncbi:hypothetical protein LguiB_013713 [Lonicera macranthoides]